MTHRFPIKEIARQAGLGTATVDRVLNNRAHVSAQTRNRVTAALRELAAQEHQLAARGRRVFVDVLVEAPRRFSHAARAACEAVLPDLTEAVYRPRFLFQEVMRDRDFEAHITRILRRGTQGVILKARDTVPVRTGVDRLQAAGIPVVTLVTDVSGTNRVAHVGVDNAKAGRTAAYLLAMRLPTRSGVIVASLSQVDFEGEQQRLAAFRQQMHEMATGFEIVEVAGGAGLDGDTRDRLSAALAPCSSVDAVYSMGGGNRAILEALKTQHQPTYIAHDLDRDNRALLQKGAITLVLHHDLTVDLRRAFRAVSAWHGLGPPVPAFQLSDVQVITPHNLPASSDF